MSRFLTRLDLEEVDDQHWRLLTPLVYDSDLVGPITIGAGFVTDLSSIPWWLPLAYVALKLVGKRAAVVHDYLYARHRPDDQRPVTRAMADRVIAEGMTALGVAPWKVAAIYVGVRLGGWWPWWQDGRQAAGSGQGSARLS